MVALSLAGSAILLFSCEGSKGEDSSVSEETMMTEYSENLSVVMSQNGRRSDHFETPLLEGYRLAREPYREFRKGVKITTYQDDSLSTVDVVLTANYAIYYENRELWEAKGDVVAEKSDGKTLYTQQLFWNARTGKIYSNVDSKIVQSGGRDVFVGEGFESDEAFKDWRFRRMKGRMEVDVKPMDKAPLAPVSQPGDSVAAGRDVQEQRERRTPSDDKAASGNTPVSAPATPAAPRRQAAEQLSEDAPLRSAPRTDQSRTDQSRTGQSRTGQSREEQPRAGQPSQTPPSGQAQPAQLIPLEK